MGHTVYNLEIERGQGQPPGGCARRFSEVDKLLNQLYGEAGQAARSSGLFYVARKEHVRLVCVKRWSQRLSAEKRNRPWFVAARITLLQSMFDELLAFPEICSSTTLASFLSG